MAWEEHESIFLLYFAILASVLIFCFTFEVWPKVKGFFRSKRDSRMGRMALAPKRWVDKRKKKNKDKKKEKTINK